jgi:hypothetical protein
MSSIRRLQLQYDSKQEEWEVLHQKLATLRQERVIKNDSESKFSLDKQIEEAEKQLNAITQELDQLEKQKLRYSLATTMPDITYEDIQFATTALLKQRLQNKKDLDSFITTDPEQKMAKNNLTHDIRFMIDMGLGKAKEVHHFIENNAKFNFPDIPDKLIKALNAEYCRLIEQEINGDSLFLALYKFAGCNSSDPRQQSAGLAILCYFFETCDVFQP